MTFSKLWQYKIFIARDHEKKAEIAFLTKRWNVFLSPPVYRKGEWSIWDSSGGGGRGWLGGREAHTYTLPLMGNIFRGAERTKVIHLYNVFLCSWLSFNVLMEQMNYFSLFFRHQTQGWGRERGGINTYVYIYVIYICILQTHILCMYIHNVHTYVSIVCKNQIYYHCMYIQWKCMYVCMCDVCLLKMEGRERFHLFIWKSTSAVESHNETFLAGGWETHFIRYTTLHCSLLCIVN